MTETKENGGYEMMKTLRKGGWVFLFGLLAFVLSVLGSLPQTATIILLTAVLAALQNFLKHRKD